MLVCLQLKYFSIARRNLDENYRILDNILKEKSDFGRTKNDILDDIFAVSLVIIKLTMAPCIIYNRYINIGYNDKQ